MIRVLAEFAGLPLTADRIPAVVAQWQVLAASLAALESLDLSECEPAIVFRAAWEE
jgi:hypothetical protein